MNKKEDYPTSNACRNLLFWRRISPYVLSKFTKIMIRIRIRPLLNLQNIFLSRYLDVRLQWNTYGIIEL